MNTKTKISHAIWGVMLIAAAAFIILSKTGYVDDVGAVKIVFTVIFAGVAISNLINIEFFGTFLPIGIIFYMYKDRMGMENVSGWIILLIVILVSIGFSMIFNTFKKKRNCYFGNNQTYYTNHDNVEQEVIDGIEEGDLNIESKFASSIKYIKKSNFTYARIKNSFGSCDVHFEGSSIVNGQAGIDIDNSFGEMKLFIPREWRIKNQTTAAAGAVEEVNPAVAGEDAPILVINGGTHFGAVKIIHC